MSSESIFNIIIAIISINFLINKVLDYFNAKHFDDEIPQELSDVYEDKEYYKSQDYKKENYKFSMLLSIFSFVLTIAFFYFEGFA